MGEDRGAGEAAVAGWTAVHRLSLLVAALMGVAAALGILAPGLYRDNALVAAGWRGTDLVTLLVAVPLLALSVRGSARGSLAWRMALLGMLLYALYDYAFYLFGAAFNSLFLAYVAIVAASGSGLLLGLAALDAGRAAAGVRPGAPARAVAAFTIGVGVLLGAFWTALSLAFLFTGRPPAMVAATGHPTNVTGALDLAVVVPLALVAGVGLRRRRPWGFVLAVVWNVQGAVYMAALSSASVAAFLAGTAGDLAQLALWVPIGLGCLLSVLALLRGYAAATVPAGADLASPPGGGGPAPRPALRPRRSG